MPGPFVRLRFEVGQFFDTYSAVLVDALARGDADQNSHGAVAVIATLARVVHVLLVDLRQVFLDFEETARLPMFPAVLFCR